MQNRTAYQVTPEQLEGIQRASITLAKRALNAQRQQKRGLITREEMLENTQGALLGVKLAIGAIYGKHAEAGMFPISDAIYNLTAGTPDQQERAEDYLTALIELLDR